MIDFKEFREDTGLSQSEFSKRFKIPLKTVQNWNSRSNTPPEYVLDMIMTILADEREIEALQRIMITKGADDYYE